MEERTCLIHELHPVREKDSLACRHLVPLQDGSPPILTMLRFYSYSFEDLSLLLLDLRVVRRPAEDITQDLQCLLISPLLIAISRRLWETEDKDNDHKRENHLARDW